MNPLASVVRTFGTGEEAASRDYECRICGATFDVQYHVCPQCNGFSVDPMPEGTDDQRTGT